MDAAVQKDLTSPLSTISPRRVIRPASAARPDPNSSTDSAESSQQTRSDAQTEQRIRQQEEQFLRDLRARDREVRAHEAAHLAAGRPYVRSGPSYTYQQGPDGRAYAIGGEVHLDTAPVSNDPQATLEKAEQIRRAALAPAQPSPQDVRVAGTAAQMAARARIEIAQQRSEEQSTASESRSRDQNNPGNPYTLVNAQGVEASLGFSQYA